jgi:hypothetical protein
MAVASPVLQRMGERAWRMELLAPALPTIYGMLLQQEVVALAI